MRVPAGLEKSGKALWRRITSEFDLKIDPDKAELLFQGRPFPLSYLGRLAW
jgi:hypothetical protein